MTLEAAAPGNRKDAGDEPEQRPVVPDEEAALGAGSLPAHAASPGADADDPDHSAAAAAAADDDDDTDTDGSSSDTGSLRDRRAWTMSPFATGFTRPTWAAEGVGLRRLCRSCWTGHRDAGLHLTACLCAPLGAGRVGNMVVCRTTTRARDPYTGEPADRPHLACVMGPYWYVLLGATAPFLLGLAVWTGVTAIPRQSPAVTAAWAACSAGALLALAQVGCRDPGVLPRYGGADPPDPAWLWSDQAATWRPVHAKYDPDCAVVVARFDHVCPWTGTAIGAGNMAWFRAFVGLTLAAVVFDTVLLTFG